MRRCKCGKSISRNKIACRSCWDALIAQVYRQAESEALNSFIKRGMQPDPGEAHSIAMDAMKQMPENRAA